MPGSVFGRCGTDSGIRPEAQRLQDRALIDALVKILGVADMCDDPAGPINRFERSGNQLRQLVAGSISPSYPTNFHIRFPPMTPEKLQPAFAIIQDWLQTKPGRKAYLANVRSDPACVQKIDITTETEAAILRILEQHLTGTAS